MDQVARLSTAERNQLFQETASRRGVRIEIIEKDFWVCWTLKNLFDLPEIGEHFIFKGGTSLSKVFQVIERFSEDIDVSINRDYLGFDGEEDPENVEGSNKRKRQLEALKEACQSKIGEELAPDAWTGLQQHEVASAVRQRAGGGQSGRSRPDDDRVDSRARHDL